jgi:glucokinase
MSDKSSNSVQYLVGDFHAKSMTLELIQFDPTHPNPTVLKSQTITSMQYPSLREYLTDFLSEFSSSEFWPLSALIAVPGAPYENKVTIEGCHWPEIVGDDLANEYNLRFKLVNSYVAVGNAMSSIDQGNITTIQHGDPDKMGSSIVVGLSDTLGECTIRAIRGHNGCVSQQIYEGHGGMKQFSPTNETEWDFYQFMMDEDPELREEYGYLPIERAICGNGIEKIYEFNCQRAKVEPQELTIWEIMDKGMYEDDEICQKSLNFLGKIYGNEVSNFAVDNIPTGGIYLVGQHSIYLKELLLKQCNNPFLDGYCSKGTEVNETLSKFPIYLVNTNNLVLMGAYIMMKNEIED